MRHPDVSHITRVALLFAVAVTIVSCGKTTAAPLPPSAGEVTQAIRDYGKGHNGLLFAPDNSLPTETDAQYGAHINELFAKEDFAQLEEAERQNRVTKARLIGGIWKSSEFFAVLAEPDHTGELKDADFQRSIAVIQRWIAAYPSSGTARIALAEVDSNYGWFARGNGYADSISASQWDLLHSRNDEALRVLLDAAKTKDRDPRWYETMEEIAQSNDWDKPRMRELFDEASAFEPEYYHYYRRYALYLDPRWHGESGDILALANETAARFPEPNGSLLYFQIMGSMACYCRPKIDELKSASWPKLQQGYRNITELYGTSNLNSNRYAVMAYAFGDQRAAHEAFAIITVP
jgi:hypothetical protein